MMMRKRRRSLSPNPRKKMSPRRRKIKMKRMENPNGKTINMSRPSKIAIKWV